MTPALGKKLAIVRGFFPRGPREAGHRRDSHCDLIAGMIVRRSFDTLPGVLLLEEIR